MNSENWEISTGIKRQPEKPKKDPVFIALEANSPRSVAVMVPPPVTFLSNPDIESDLQIATLNYLGKTRNRVQMRVNTRVFPEIRQENPDFHIESLIGQAAEILSDTNKNVKIKPISPGKYISKTSENTKTELENGYRVTYQTPLFSSGMNTWVSAYNYDVMSGKLDVEFETAQFSYVTGDGVSTDIFDNFIFREQGSSGVSNPCEYYSHRRKSNITVKAWRRSSPFYGSLPHNEMRALGTLREMISESSYRKYIKYGYIIVHGRTGNLYQIFRNSTHTKVWRDGKLVEEVCVRINGIHRTPPTDNVIALMTMIQVDEEEFKSLGNVYKMAKAA